jgi:membrane protein YdbS with pleckstrin-like domain
MTPHDDSTNDANREEIQLPPPTLLPLAVAAGVTISLVGLILSWWFVAFGALVTLIAVVRWARTVRSEIAELPSERS